MEKLSIVIPFYNDFDTIGDTLDSILSQSFKDFEVVIFGNCKKENLPVYSYFDKRVKIYYEPVNTGLGHNLNEGYLHATGDIVMFMSANDILLPGSLKKVYDILSGLPSIAVMVNPYYFFYNDYTKPIRYTKQSVDNVDDAIALCGQMSGITIRKSYMLRPFGNKSFVEFASAVVPMLRVFQYASLETPVVAVRNKYGGSYNSKAYIQSPTQNWIDVCEIDIARKIFGKNYVGLIQVKAYGGTIKFLREVWCMLRLEPMNLISPKFWLYFPLVLITPASLIRFMVNLWWRTR